MPQNITRSVEDLVAEASSKIRTLSIGEARDMLGRDDVLFIDVRDVRELAESGRIPGARHVPRGLLEFWIDPKSPYHKEFLAEDKTFIFYCAVDWRSALCTRVAQDMGLAPVAHLQGGFNAWKEAGGPVEAPKAK
ncbi:MAG: rhodanese-like domain-containing protein [Alphaproteobacteria bacterium]|nr:rhodanese-like domain-containing protein [Alphaproteobacteria bacterium]